MQIYAHTRFQHDCGDDPFDWSGHDQQSVFLEGHAYDVPDAAAEFFIRAGWATRDANEQPVQPDSTRPVLVQPDDAAMGTSDTN